MREIGSAHVAIAWQVIQSMDIETVNTRLETSGGGGKKAANQSGFWTGHFSILILMLLTPGHLLPRAISS